MFVNFNANYADGSSAAINPFVNGLVEGDDGFDMQNDSRVIANAQIGYEWNETFGVYFIASNLFDEEYIDSASSTGFVEGVNPANHTLGNPRQLSVSLRGRF